MNQKIKNPCRGEFYFDVFAVLDNPTQSVSNLFDVEALKDKVYELEISYKPRSVNAPFFVEKGRLYMNTQMFNKYILNVKQFRKNTQYTMALFGLRYAPNIAESGMNIKYFYTHSSAMQSRRYNTASAINTRNKINTDKLINFISTKVHIV